MSLTPLKDVFTSDGGIVILIILAVSIAYFLW
jgi:hypothetical protein